MLASGGSESSFGHCLFDKIWQEQRRVATAAQNHLQEPIVGNRPFDLGPLQSQTNDGFIAGM